MEQQPQKEIGTRMGCLTFIVLAAILIQAWNGQPIDQVAIIAFIILLLLGF